MTIAVADQKCSNCCFARTKAGTVYCCVEAPKRPMPGAGNALWPQVHGDDWCGCWTAIPAPAKGA